MSFVILSDFDGVWTEPAHEAACVLEELIERSSSLASIPIQQARGHFENFRKLTVEQPARHGWAPDGRITAYVDEDPFCLSNSIAGYLQNAPGELESTYRAAIESAGHETLSSFADRCFQDATARYRREHPAALTHNAAEVLEGLHDADAHVVVVSNSDAAKLIDWFRSVGIDAGESPEHTLEVRGAARKFELGPSDRALEVGGRRIHVDRPAYAAAIHDIAPALVIGDVFSLDLALPHELRDARHPSAPETLVLRAHAHTPDWVRTTRADGAIDHVIEDLSELIALVPRPA